MATVLVNDTVKKYLLGQMKGFRERVREKFEFLETGIWEGKLRAKKLKGISSKCIFEAPIDKNHRLLFTLGSQGENSKKDLVVYVWGVATHDDLNKKIRHVIPENVPFLRFHDIEEVLLEDVVMEDLEPSYFTQERITEKTKDESGSQRWYPVEEPEWKRIRLYSRDEFEFFLCLTPEQKEILESSLPLMVSGTAGSGKTTLSLYYLLKRHLHGKKKLFITYNRYLKSFAERLYGGLLNEAEWKNDIMSPDFYVFKDFLLDTARRFGKTFSPEKEVDFNRFSRMYASHPLHQKFDPTLVWEEIRSIIKGALPQVNMIILEQGIRAVRSKEFDLSFINRLQQQFILFAKLESLKAVGRCVEKYLKTDIFSFCAHMEKYLQDEGHRDRVLSVFDRTLHEIQKQKDVVHKKYLSFLEYEFLGKKKAPNFQFNRKEIYPVIDWYQNRLESDGLWDELDLTREVLKIYSEKNLEVPAYDVLACDEVQDFTDIQISLLLAMVNNPRDVFFAGDTKQTINPSGFRWEEVKRNFYERGLEVPELKYLALNFRSSGSIVELSNILLGLKEKYLGIKAEEIREEWRYKGRPVTVVSGISEKDMLEILKIAGARRTVLVRTEEEKRRLQRLLETELVFTIGDAKGLEFDTVVLWKFCDDQLMEDVWKVILDMTKRSIHEAKIRHEINLLYVGITRSQKDLIIYDGGNPSLIWENPQFKSHVYATDDRSFIGGIWNVLTTPEEWIEQGHYFFEREFYRAAMECYKNGGDEKLFARASAYDSEKAGKYFDAALIFEKIGERERAAGNYERAGAYKKALPLWEKLKNRERMFHCRIEIYQQEGKHSQAGRLYLQRKKYEEAIQCFRKSSDYRAIAEIYLKNLKDLREAAVHFEQSHDFEKAAGLYCRLKSHEKAAELFWRSGSFRKAENLWKRTGNTNRLLGLYEKTGQHEKMLKIYEDQKNFEKAVKCLKAMKDKCYIAQEAETLFSRQKYFQALARFFALDNHKRTAECYLHLKNKEEAIRHFKLAGDFDSAGKVYQKIKDYKSALESFLNSEEDRKEGYPLVKQLVKKISDSRWIYTLGYDLFKRERYGEAAVLFSTFRNTYPEVGICYVFLKDEEKAFQAWKKITHSKDHERIADICLSVRAVESGARFFLRHQQEVLSSYNWIPTLSFKKNSILGFMDIYFMKNPDPDEMRLWGNFLGKLDFKGDVWEKTLSYLERGGDYNFLMEYLDRLKFFNITAFKDISKRWRREIPELTRSESWEGLALRNFFLNKADEFNKLLPRINIHAHNYALYLIGEKESYETGVSWCSKNSLLPEAAKILSRLGRYDRAADIFERSGNLSKAAAYYSLAHKPEKAAMFYEVLKSFSMAGDAYYKSGDYRNALRMYEKQTPPNKKKIAKTCEKLGDFARALTLWKETGDKKAIEKCTGRWEKAKQKELRFPSSE